MKRSPVLRSYGDLSEFFYQLGTRESLAWSQQSSLLKMALGPLSALKMKRPLLKKLEGRFDPEIMAVLKSYCEGAKLSTQDYLLHGLAWELAPCPGGIEAFGHAPFLLTRHTLLNDKKGIAEFRQFYSPRFGREHNRRIHLKSSSLPQCWMEGPGGNIAPGLSMGTAEGAYISWGQFYGPSYPEGAPLFQLLFSLLSSVSSDQELEKWFKRNPSLGPLSLFIQVSNSGSCYTARCLYGKWSFERLTDDQSFFAPSYSHKQSQEFYPSTEIKAKRLRGEIKKLFKAGTTTWKIKDLLYSKVSEELSPDLCAINLIQKDAMTFQRGPLMELYKRTSLNSPSQILEIKKSKEKLGAQLSHHQLAYESLIRNELQETLYYLQLAIQFGPSQSLKKRLAPFFIALHLRDHPSKGELYKRGQELLEMSHDRSMPPYSKSLSKVLALRILKGLNQEAPTHNPKQTLLVSAHQAQWTIEKVLPSGPLFAHLLHLLTQINLAEEDIYHNLQRFNLT